MITKTEKIVVYLIVIGLLLVIGVTTFFNKSSTQGMIKDLKSEWNGGLERTVKVYNYVTDKPIITYSGKINIFNDINSKEVELIVDGKRIVIRGGIIIIEER